MKSQQFHKGPQECPPPSEGPVYPQHSPNHIYVIYNIFECIIPTEVTDLFSQETWSLQYH